MLAEVQEESIDCSGSKFRPLESAPSKKLERFHTRLKREFTTNETQAHGEETTEGSAGSLEKSRRLLKMSERYHRGELKIALDPTHPAHILPPALPPSWKVLDIGCGAGQTLIAAYPDRLSFGVDVDLEALKLGKSLTDHVCFVCGKAETLPFPNGHFDIVIARVSLAYTDISASLNEINRVLRKGGRLWMTLHPFSIAWRQAKSSNYKGWIYFCYIVLNSVLFHLTRRQFPFLGRYESFQTEKGISQALKQNGFEGISLTRNRHFLVTAVSVNSL
jgi:ubiquinone/menaquinone biosynthesis C-methylase UbiE